MKGNKNIIYRIALSLLLAVSAGFCAVAQENAEPEKIYTVVEQMPTYPGGDQGLATFISQNVKYPLDAQQKGIEGRVFVSFIVDKEGNLRDAKVEKGIGGGCDEEALRVVKLLSGWKAAYQNGKPVNFRYILPIKFKLTDNTLPETRATGVYGNEPLYAIVDKFPVYSKGGEEGMFETIYKNLKYPKKAKKDGIVGTVYIAAVIDKTGKLAQATVRNGIGAGCDEEAIRVAKLLENWEPGYVRGEKVNSEYIIPIRFGKE